MRLRFPRIDRRHLRWWWQRRTRGFDERELWALDYTILEFVLPRLRAYTNEHCVHYLSEHIYGEDPTLEEALRIDALPEEERKELRNEASLKWNQDLQKMVWSIDLYLRKGGMIMFNEKGERDGELNARFQEGWDLFHKHFFALWT